MIDGATKWLRHLFFLCNRFCIHLSKKELAAVVTLDFFTIFAIENSEDTTSRHKKECNSFVLLSIYSYLCRVIKLKTIMRRILCVCAILMANVLTMSAAKKTVIDRIEPTDWFVGMKNPQVQLMVYGQGIRNVTSVTTNYPGVKIDSIVRLDSPNYLLVYMNLKEAQPGTMTLCFDKLKVKYQLKQREMSGDKRMGFTNADVLYMLMPDRFAQGANHPKQVKGMRAYVEDRNQPSLRHGGDLNGIREHLDYFKELGVTALWFTPVLENDSPDSENGFSTYHGYATTNYYRVDPRFGSNEDYRRLCDEAHAKGLKIVMDMIFNHSGFEHPWTLDLPTKEWLNVPDWIKESNGTSDANGTSFLQTSYKLTPIVDPYASKVDLKETTEGWFVPTMPDLNQHNPHLMRYLIQNSFWWIETVGIDGIRMDTYPYAYADAMAQWMKELNEEYPNFNTVGETWVTEPAYTATWQKDSKLAEKNSYLKTVMDFSFYDKMNSAKNEETDGNFNGLQRLYNSFVYDYLYPNPSSVMAFIENHDTDRFLGNGRDTLALKQALALLLTVNRIPQLYYGTEVLMNGTKEVTDGNVRKDFPGGFPDDTHNCFTKEGRSQSEQSMFSWLSRLLHWRQGNEVIVKGSQIQFIPYQGVYVIARQHQGKTVLTVLNGTSKPTVMEVSRYAEVIGQTGRAKDVLTGRFFDLSKNLQLKPRQSLILTF
jgi:glycosidase